MAAKEESDFTMGTFRPPFLQVAFPLIIETSESDTQRPIILIVLWSSVGQTNQPPNLSQSSDLKK